MPKANSKKADYVKISRRTWESARSDPGLVELIEELEDREDLCRAKEKATGVIPRERYLASRKRRGLGV